MDVFENMEISSKKFEELEKKFKSVIAKCNSSNLVDKKENSGNQYNVKNATDVEHYKLDNGLHIYKILNNDQPISYWIASTPLYVEHMYKGFDNNDYVTTRYSGIPAFEYSIGGVGNSLAIDVSNYSVYKHISVVFGEEGRRMKTDVMASSGFKLSGPDIGKFCGFTGYQHDDFDYMTMTGKNQELYDSGDLIGYLNNIKPHNDEDANILSSLKDTMNMVEQLSLNDVKNEEHSNEKKSFLKKLLGRNKKLDSEIDAFSKKDGRKR